MRAGDLNRRVAIQARSSSTNSWGQQSTTWSDVLANVPAAIEPLAGRELELARAVNAEVSGRITVRYHPQLANPIAMAGWRVVYAANGVNRVFNIVGARNIDERNRTVELWVSEGLNEG